MPTPTPTTPTKGAGTTFWIYTGTGDPYDDPLSDVGGHERQRLRN